ncbi:MAG: hypothetical protein KBB11_00100 [Bacteroidales bacterium]|nr:hypothetical protein [Bacteroidales bacterium]HOY39707.1 hypothetical protein [Bacteroidales bacterium]HQP03916.1 hypothetical protein [Bacteroidales bacterium]
MVEKIIKYLGWAVFALTAILSLLFFFKDYPGLSTEISKIEGLTSVDKQIATAQIASNWSATLLNFAGIMLFVTIGLVIVFALYAFIANFLIEPKKAIRSLMSILAIGAVVVVAYILASDAIPVFIGSEKLEITPRLSKWVDTSLYTTYIVFGAALIMTLYSEVSKIWK